MCLIMGLWGLLAFPCLAGAKGGDDSGRAPGFNRDIRPILARHCLKCHGIEARKGGLDLRSPGRMLRGGENGPALVKGSAKESLLYEQVRTGTMPPGKVKLTADEIATIRDWINAGASSDESEPPSLPEPAPLISASERDYWAFRPLAHPKVPTVRAAGRVRTPIDAFLLAALERRGIGFSPEADRTVLIRRATFDLTGLPPTPDEVDTFLADERPDAYERLIDRLLDSPHYGERWGRHWLDAAGYADTAGVDNDAAIIYPREGIWRYRDYVVRSLNADKPFDRFLTEQIAGDELADWQSAATFTPEVRDCLIATGFLRSAFDDTDQDELNLPLQRYQVLHGTIEILTSNLLGLTVACARCHDHKFDPIPQRDYYRLMALFTPSYDVQHWIKPKERHLADVAPVEKEAIDRSNADIDRQVEALKSQIEAVRKANEARLVAARLTAIPEPIRADTKAALDTPAEKRTAIQRYLAERLGPGLRIRPEEVDRALSRDDRSQIDNRWWRISTLNSRKRSYGKIQALYEVGPPSPTHLHRRGNHENPGPIVAPGFPSVLDDPGGPEAVSSPPGTRSSGRRLALARWLTRPATRACSLSTRVLVNRVWQHHFGRGIVATSENFGRQGTPPTHPELLDWLTGELVRGGWRLKSLHRLIMTSTAYRQASRRDEARSPDPEVIDPENRLLWRMPLRRLEAEAVRDTLLAASGALDRTFGGPPIGLDARTDGLVVIDEKRFPSPSARNRRSLYLLARRNYQLSLLSTFDAPLMNSNCLRRVGSTVPLQALALMNGAFAWEQAGRLADRLERQAPGDRGRQIDLAFRRTLSRPPSRDELAAAAELLATQVDRHARANPSASRPQSERMALVHLALMLFNTNEFLYIE